VGRCSSQLRRPYLVSATESPLLTVARHIADETFQSPSASEYADENIAGINLCEGRFGNLQHVVSGAVGQSADDYDITGARLFGGWITAQCAKG